MPHEDRPVTRLARLGPSPLTLVELLSVIIGGDKGLACAENLVKKYLHGGTSSIRDLTALSVEELCAIDGIGNGTALQLKAAMELGRRLHLAERPQGTPIQSPRDVVQFYAPLMEDLPVEECHIAVLDAQHRMVRDVTITRGILNSSLVGAREVFREAIKYQAAAIILVHNHPSGDPAPSFDDRAVTDQIAAAGRIMDIPVHDHVIIGRGRYTSFAEAGLL